MLKAGLKTGVLLTDVIPRAPKIETRSDSELSKKNGGLIRPTGFFFFRNILG